MMDGYATQLRPAKRKVVTACLLAHSINVLSARLAVFQWSNGDQVHADAAQEAFNRVHEALIQTEADFHKAAKQEAA